MNNAMSPDDMEWTPTRDTIVLHQSTPPLQLPFKRKLDDISGGADILGRMQQPKLCCIGEEPDAHAQAQPWLHPLLLVRQYFLAVALCAFHSADKAYAGAKRRWFPPNTPPITIPPESQRTHTVRKKKGSPLGRKNLFQSPLRIPGTYPLSSRSPPGVHYPQETAHAPAMPISGAAPMPVDLSDQYTVSLKEEAENVRSIRKTPPIKQSVKIFTELDDIGSAFASPAVTLDPPKEASLPPERPALKLKSANIETPPPYETPVKVRKNVAFAASPRTGRPVTRTKRYAVGEAIDYPTPSPTESSHMTETPSLNAPLTPSPFHPYDPALSSNGSSPMTGFSSTSAAGVYQNSPSSDSSPNTPEGCQSLSQDEATPEPHTPKSTRSSGTSSRLLNFFYHRRFASEPSSADAATLSDGQSSSTAAHQDEATLSYLPESETDTPSKGLSYFMENSRDGNLSQSLASSLPISGSDTPSEGSSSLLENSSDESASLMPAQTRDATSSSKRSSPSVGFSQDEYVGTAFDQTPEDRPSLGLNIHNLREASSTESVASTAISSLSAPFETPIRRKSSPDLSKGLAELEIVSEVKPIGLGDSGRRRSDRHRRRIELEELERAKRAEEARLQEIERKKELEEKIRREGLRRIPRTAAIPPLSAGAHDVVAEALKKGMQTKVALTSNGTAITRRDIGKVLPQRGTSDDISGWLNDEVITAYLQMIVEHGHLKHGHKRNETPKYHAFNAFFYTNLKNKGYDGVKRWAKKAKIGGKDLLQTDHIFIPVNQSGNHWTMAIVSPKHKRIEYFDSLHFSSEAVYQNVRKWLKGELGAAYKAEEWTEGVEAGYEGRGCGPTQSNGSDCGVFAITTAKMVLLGIDPKAVSAADMPLQRRRIVAEILNGGFSGEFEPIVEFD